jgi:hypothetical protein
MNLQQIIKAVKAGKTVFFKTSEFRVTSDFQEVFSSKCLTARPLCTEGLLIGGSHNYYTA